MAGWLEIATAGGGETRTPHSIVDGDYSAHAAEQRANAIVGRRMTAEERRQAAHERLHDEHVRRGRVGVERHALTHRVDLTQGVGEPVWVSSDLRTAGIG